MENLEHEHDHLSDEMHEDDQLHEDVVIPQSKLPPKFRAEKKRKEEVFILIDKSKGRLVRLVGLNGNGRKATMNITETLSDLNEKAILTYLKAAARQYSDKK